MAARPLRLVCELARKAHDAGQWTLVLARDLAQAEALDDLLWAFDEDDLAPVLIATPDMDVALRPLVLNLRDAALEGTFERVLEVVPADDSAREPLRERWKQYKARGLDVNKHDM